MDEDKNVHVSPAVTGQMAKAAMDMYEAAYAQGQRHGREVARLELAIDLLRKADESQVPAVRSALLAIARGLGGGAE